MHVRVVWRERPAPEYTVIWDYNHLDFINKVNFAMKEGWRPQGGISVIRENGYRQAMVRGI